MNFFVDTNIPIGYTVIHDRLHEKSKTFIDNHETDSIFWSTLVKKEYHETLNDLIDEVKIFLEYCKSILKANQNDFINYYEFENFILNKTKECTLDYRKKQKILEDFWKNTNFNEGIGEIIYFKFREFLHDFQQLYIKRQKMLREIMILHNCGLDNYLRYFNYAKQLYEWGVHRPDCKIIADAHDCGKTHDNLIFVSADKKMIKIITSHNTSFLNIAEFKSCN
ncbi:hypothetical protein [Methanobrevibacter sp.]|uniref:hypothetical protein n=2 Tax=Methanobrevibacter sp. TaxID=66852 RepID=UPI0038901940